MDQKHKILVIDDDLDVIELIESVLSDSGFKTITALDGLDGLKKAQDNWPDLILLDIKLPGMDGFEVCRKLRAIECSQCTPIIMMTAEPDSKKLIKCLEIGADEFIPKPFDMYEFNARIKAILRSKTNYDKISKDLEDKINEKNLKLQNLYLETINALIRTLNAKDNYTYRHSRNVAKYSGILSKKLGFSSKEVSEIEKAGQLHDLGKIGVSDQILNKKDKLTDEEWKQIRTHSSRSAQILEPLECMSGIIDMVKQHHERIDGSGYPDGIKGKDITIGAKILAVADSYDAMTSKRPYRKAFPKDHAVVELEKNAGTQFDSEIVKVFLSLLKHKKKK